MFKCYVCKEFKPAEDFNKDRTRPSGLMSKCKDCSKLITRAKRKTPQGKIKRVILSRRWKRANKFKEHAHKAVARAIKSGRILKPKECTVCGSPVEIEGHHPDYNFKLQVIWLCKQCHINLHKEKYATR